MPRRFKQRKIFWILGTILSLVLLFDIFQMNSFTSEKYLIQKYKQKLDNLIKENNMLEINVSRLNSLSNIDNYLAKNNFVRENKVKYIRIFESSVVAK